VNYFAKARVILFSTIQQQAAHPRFHATAKLTIFSHGRFAATWEYQVHDSPHLVNDLTDSHYIGRRLVFNKIAGRWILAVR